MRRSDLVQHKEREKGAPTRTSQIVFGERQHLLRVLDSLEGTELPIARMQQERRILEELIHARTRDLNQINTAWDEKIGLVLSADGHLTATDLPGDFHGSLDVVERFSGKGSWSIITKDGRQQLQLNFDGAYGTQFDIAKDGGAWKLRYFLGDPDEYRRLEYAKATGP